MTRSRTARSSLRLAWVIAAVVIVAAPLAPPVSAEGGASQRGGPLIPTGPPATHYRSAAGAADRAALAPDPLRTAIRAGVSAGLRQKGLPVPEEDARLDAAMNDLARGLAPDDLPVADTVAFLLAHYGVIELSPHWLLERATAGDERQAGARIAADLVEELARTPAARLGLGIARTDTALDVVVALQDRSLEIAPLPRQLALEASASVTGRLVGRSGAPQLVMTAPDGGVHEVALGGKAPRFQGTLRCLAGPGPYQIEITGVDAGGPTVLANFPLYCGVAPPRAAPGPAGAPRGLASAPAAEAGILALLNRDRAATGLPPLRLDDKLSDVARAHSRDMATHDFVAHVSPTTGTFVERVVRSGINPALLLENVGRAYSAADAHRGFMASPVHRRNVLDRRATRVGIGVAVGKEISGASPLFVTQLMM